MFYLWRLILLANDYKKDSLYVFGVVCANGVQDTWGDTLTKKDIKKLNSSYKSHEVDTNHNYLKNIGVNVVENYITTVPMIVRGKDVPVGSWVMGMLVWDKTLKDNIRSGELNGYSLCSRPDTPELMAKFINRNDPPNYREIEDKDDLKPLFVSIVNGASNGYQFEYTTYSAYIERGHKEENPMSETEFEKFMDYLQIMNTYIERNNPQPQTDEKDEEITKLKEELKQTRESYDALIEKQNSDKEELMNAISELKEQNKDPEPQGEEDPEPQGGEDPEPKGEPDPDPQGNDDPKDINRGNPNDFQTKGGAGNPQPTVVPVDKFFDDGFVPRNRGYGGLPL